MDALLKMPLMADLSPTARELIAARARKRMVTAGEMIVKQGARDTDMYIISEGSFRVTTACEALGIERDLKTLIPGDCFGETALLSGEPRTANVQAVDRGELWVLSRADLEAVAKEEPETLLALCRMLARRFEAMSRREPAVRFLHLEDFPDVHKHCSVLHQRVSGYCRAIVLEASTDHVLVAMVNPLDATNRGFIREALRGQRVDFAAISADDFERFAASHFQQPSRPAAADIQTVGVEAIDSSGQPQPLGEHQTAEILKMSLRTAALSGGSDLHFEPGEKTGQIRMRLDGELAIIEPDIPMRLFERVISRLKVMSQLDIAERRRAQDGRFTLSVGERRFDVRLSTMPCIAGEKIVLRLLDSSQQRRRLRDLVLSGPLCEKLVDVFHSPTGLILVAGPTGSGKTTTLYAGLEEIWQATRAVNIITLENPVEYHLPYATQVQVDRTVGATFSQSLSTAMRQDPDVVFVGEMRDEESANIAVEAATTGHLVLSTVHCDYATEAIARLRRLNVKTFLIAATLRCVIAQRLVPRVCQACAESASDQPIVDRLIASRVIDAAERTTLRRGVGCAVCQGRGTIGRVGLYEVLLVDQTVRTLIERDAGWSEISAALTNENFVSLQRYAKFLLTQGIISPEHAAECFPLQQSFAGVL